MVRRAGGGIGNVSVSQDAKSPPGKICLRISQHALKPDSYGGNVPISQDNQSLFCKVCGTGPEYSSAPNPESLADNGKLAEKAVDYT